MKQKLKQLIEETLTQLNASGTLTVPSDRQVVVDHTKDKAHGDFACNVAMMLAKPAQKKPREIAELIVAHFPKNELIEKIDIAGPGFINFYLTDAALHSIVKIIHEQKEKFGRSDFAKGKKVHIEFVSSNPTGPLHVGHGRGASYGSAVSDLLEAIGYDVHREYYINDAGRQMHILATSVWLRYLELQGQVFPFPKNAYKGQYVLDIAKVLIEKGGQAFVHPIADVFLNVPADEGEEGGDKETHIDALIVNAQTLLKDTYQTVFQLALNTILDDIKQDLHEFCVDYQEWFSEQKLLDSGAVDHAVSQLKTLGFTYEKDGATWFRATDFGDDKDRVLIRADGRTTYFTSDVAYHVNKVERGFDLIINVLGADHHGYVPRVRAAMRALGKSDKEFIVPMVQFATLYRGDEKVQMSTRSGDFVTLRELREEIGKDAARFFYIMRKAEHHMDFDLELAKSTSSDNPVYYVQYAHARICSVLRQAKEKGFSYDSALGLTHIALLTSQHEMIILNELMRYPDIIHAAAIHYEPHVLTNYLKDLASQLHTYYNATPFLVDEENVRCARLCLIEAVKQVLVNGLALLSVSAPEKM